MSRRRGVLLAGGVLVAGLVFLAVQPAVMAAVADVEGYEHSEVRTLDRNGTHLGTVDVRIADTTSKRYTGLSETDSLARNEGMFFVHESEQQLAYVMRDMNFSLDIAFVAANGTVTRIHHAPVPEEGTTSLERYRGTGKYVLEVNRGWTNRTGLDAGDHVCGPAL